MDWAERANPNSEYNRTRREERWVKKMNSFIRVLKRFGRATAALLIAGGIAAATKDPKWIIFAQVLQALGKFLREKLDIPNVPV